MDLNCITLIRLAGAKRWGGKAERKWNFDLMKERNPKALWR